MKESYVDVVVKNALNKQTIYSYLKSLGHSENYLKNLRKQSGFIKLNNEVCFMDKIVDNGDVISINNNPNSNSKLQLCDIKLDVIYEDNDIVAINKPSGLATMPSRSHYMNNLAGAILNYYGGDFVVRIINRLDKDACGIVLVAKNSLASNFLNRDENVQKTYYAICSGNLNEDIVIDKNIVTMCNNGINQNKRETSDTLGKPAKTYVEVVKNFDGYSLAKIKIEHGRTHQIRVHMSSIGHSLIGDELYGQKSEKISHTALLLKEISFVQPTTKKIISLSVDFPDDFLKLINLERG